MLRTINVFDSQHHDIAIAHLDAAAVKHRVAAAGQILDRENGVVGIALNYICFGKNHENALLECVRLNHGQKRFPAPLSFT